VNRRQQLMEAGIAVFADKGYHRTNVSDIVRRAGVPPGAFSLVRQQKEPVSQPAR
jgi:TetR/AcrR family transcriptional repressor of nem operon